MAARLFAVVVFAAALVVAPVAWRGSVAVAATAFTDVPTTATVGTPYTFSGTVTDESPVAEVEVSTDGGVAWRAATWQVGQAAWSHTFTPSGSGTAQLRVRALNAAEDVVGEASAETSVAARVCPCGR
ncbi:Ig-like domain-containing protein [Saccharothrix sp. ALI-22-I]|uniref:Ig-like domain-containing protein n=1 Tax=Saccharothrix sp. ALI-22-I TaxID=1933778 RepID=UPI0015C3866E|nr:Ig-like domain-containing protein [Saccharothrix sp. ALI-22-I]